MRKLPKYMPGNKRVVSMRMHPFTAKVLDMLAGATGRTRSELINYFIYKGLPERVEPKGVLELNDWRPFNKGEVEAKIEELFS